MKILVTGGDGQLGKAFQKVLPKENVFFVTRGDFDITDKKQTIQQITSIRPEIVIHTAAYTDVDGCEKNPDLAYKVNVKGTENITMACQKIGATMIFISTDYIFDSKKGAPYNEEDKPNPLSVYGQTKLQGEEIVKKLPKYFIIRTAWLFGQGKNFVQTILNLAKERKEIKVVNDQIGSPTYTQDAAEAIWNLIKTKKFGIYHITNQGQCSWYEFAKEIINQKNLPTKVIPASSSEWQKIKPDSAKRPRYSVLSNKKIRTLFRKNLVSRRGLEINALGIKLRPWQEALKEYLKE